MERFKAINYHETRDFSRKMSVTFEFIRQNFAGLSKSILFIAGPPVLVASLFLGSFMRDMFSVSFNAGRGAPPDFSQVFGAPTFWLQLALMLVFLIVSTVTTIATINNYILLYEEKGTNRIATGEVWTRVRNTFWMYLGSTILFTILGIVVYVVMIIPVALLASISPFLIFFGIVALFCAILYLAISVSLLFIVQAYEKLGFFDALGRSFRLVQGKWWSTFGLIFVLYLIAIVVSYIFMIPAYVLSIITSLHQSGAGGFETPGAGYQTIILILFALYYLSQMILYSLPNVGIAFQYFNLVERKEARGLMRQIDSIGEVTPSSSTQDEHY